METIIQKTDNLTITLTDETHSTEQSYIDQQIMAFNNQVSPHHKAVRVNKPKPLNVFIHNSQGVLIGGLVASTYWGWLSIDDFWLSEALRKQGYGTGMLQAVEEEAQDRGCKRVVLKTFSFQAKDFYEKYGYRVIGQLDDYPPGETFYWMRKDFGH